MSELDENTLVNNHHATNNGKLQKVQTNESLNLA
jgi:hypothetical protein